MSATKRYLEEIGFFEANRDLDTMYKHVEYLESEYYSTSSSCSFHSDDLDTADPLETLPQ